MRRIGQNRRLMRMRLAGNIIGQAGCLAGKRARNGYELVARKERETWHCMPRKADREGKSSAVGGNGARAAHKYEEKEQEHGARIGCKGTCRAYRQGGEKAKIERKYIPEL